MNWYLSFEYESLMVMKMMDVLSLKGGQGGYSAISYFSTMYNFAF